MANRLVFLKVQKHEYHTQNECDDAKSGKRQERNRIDE